MIKIGKTEVEYGEPKMARRDSTLKTTSAVFVKLDTQTPVRMYQFFIAGK